MNLKAAIRYSVIFIFSLGLSYSCSRGPIYKSVAESKMKDETHFIGFDNQSAIRYAFSNDSDYLYVRLEALSKSSVMKIIQSGFYIYFDTLEKRNKEMNFNFPMGETDQVFKSKLYRKGNKENAAVAGKLELESKIKDVGKFAAFHVAGKEVKVENDLEKGFAFKLNPGEYGSLSYYAAIRLDKIKKGGLKNINKLSVGIISGSFKKPNLAGSDGGRGRYGNNRYGGGGMGGGMGAGMGTPQASQSNADRQKMRERYLMSQPINFWVHLQLYKP